LDEQPQLGIASTRRSFFAHRKSFYRGFLIAVPAFLLAVEFLSGRYVLLRNLVAKNTRLNSRTVCSGAVLKFDTRLGGSDLVYF